MVIHSIGQMIDELVEHCNERNYGHDFLKTWEKEEWAIRATVMCSEILKMMHRSGISSKMFDTGLGISIFKDQSTRTRYSFNSAMNFLGLDPVELDMGKSQLTHGETVLETAIMVSFLTRVIGIRDDVYLGVGHRFIEQMGDAVDKGVSEGVLDYRPSLINLQSDIDHPTQSMADLAHLVEYLDGFENLAGKKITMSWAYSPSYGKPLSVPQGVIGLLSRFGVDLTLAYPEGYTLLPEVIEVVKNQTENSGGRFRTTNAMAEAFEGADIVYPKSWASMRIMNERTALLNGGNTSAYEELEKDALAENARYLDWQVDSKLMKKTREGQALYMHCLPAEIAGESLIKGRITKVGEVTKDVFDHYRTALYKQAKNKPFIIASMALLGQCGEPITTLRNMVNRWTKLNLFT